MGNYIAALSGGVDSSVAAAEMLAQGHNVTGVHFALNKNSSRTTPSGAPRARGCCSLDDSRDARRVADTLDIPFYVWDLSDEFNEKVVGNFVEEYRSGNTPNPCMRCNEHIKFATALDRALGMGFDGIITGHYADVRVNPDTGAYSLHRAVDIAKDQSYVVSVLPNDSLQYCLFPLGKILSKKEVRAKAEMAGLATAHKPDSSDICFVSDGDTKGWISRKLGNVPGDIIDQATGKILGQHMGAHLHTVGQRRGLNLGDVASEQRRYVTVTDTKTNTVFVGVKEMLATHSFRISDIVWPSSPSPVMGEWPAEVQIRAHGNPISATINSNSDGNVLVELDAPEHGVAPGQQAVVYRGDEVVMSGKISVSR